MINGTSHNTAFAYVRLMVAFAPPGLVCIDKIFSMPRSVGHTSYTTPQRRIYFRFFFCMMAPPSDGTVSTTLNNHQILTHVVQLIGPVSLTLSMYILCVLLFKLYRLPKRNHRVQFLCVCWVAFLYLDSELFPSHQQKKKKNNDLAEPNLSL